MLLVTLQTDYTNVDAHSQLLFYPLSAILTLGLLLMCFFIFDGIFKMTSSMQMRPAPAWEGSFLAVFCPFCSSF